MQRVRTDRQLEGPRSHAVRSGAEPYAKAARCRLIDQPAILADHPVCQRQTEAVDHGIKWKSDQLQAGKRQLELLRSNRFTESC